MHVFERLVVLHEHIRKPLSRADDDGILQLEEKGFFFEAVGAQAVDVNLHV